MLRKFTAIVLVLAMCLGLVTTVDATENKQDEQMEINENELAKQFHKVEDKIFEDYYDVKMLNSTEETAILSGTVSIESGASVTDGRVSVSVYKIDKTNNKINGPTSQRCAAKYYDLTNGQVDYSFELPKGSYAIMTALERGYSDVVNYDVYYAASGMVDSITLADCIDLNENKAINLIIPKAERVIKGRVTFAEAITEETEVYFNIGSEDNYVQYPYVYYKVQAGNTYLDYSIGVDKGNYNIQISMNGYLNKYYSIYNTADEYEKRAMINVEDASAENIDFTYSKGVAAEELNVKVKLSKAETEDIKYRLFFANNGSTNQSSDRTIAAGETEHNYTMSLGNRKSGYLAVVRSDYVNNIYEQESIFYFYSESKGITTKIEEATLIDLTTTEDVTITIPEMVTLNGTIQRNGAAEGENIDLTVIAEIEGEKYHTYIRMSAKENSVDYSIDIPKNYVGKAANVYVNLRERGTSRQLLAITDTKNTEISESMEDVDFTGFTENLFVRISGKIQLDNPAEKNGVKITISSTFNVRQNSNISYRNADFCIPNGATTLEYSTYILNTDKTKNDSENIKVSVSASSSDTRYNISRGVSISPDVSDDVNVMLYCKMATVSGKIKVAESVTLTSSALYNLNLTCSYKGTTYYLYSYISPKLNSNEVSYKFYVPNGATVTNFYLSIINAGSNAIDRRQLYYDGSGTSYDYSSASKTVTDALIIDFNIAKAKLVRGKIIVPEDCQVSGNVGIFAGGRHTGNIRITSAGEYEYVAAVPEATTSTTIMIGITPDGQSNVYTGNTYYSSSGTTYKSSEAENVALSNDVTNNIDITVIKGISITGTVSFEDGATINGNASLQVYVEGEGFSNSISKQIDSASNVEYTASVPEVIGNSVCLKVYLYTYSGTTTNVATGYYYYDGDSKLTSNSDAKTTIDATQNSTVDMTIPMPYCITGKINYPQNVIGKATSGTMYLRYAWGSGFKNESCKMTISEDGTYVANIPSIDREYSAIYVSFDFPNKSNIIQSSYYYVNKDTSSRNDSDSTVVEVNGSLSDINFHLEEGNTISGKIVMPKSVEHQSSMYSNIYLISSTPYLYSYYSISLTGKETEYMIAYPKDITNGVELKYYGGGGALYSDYAYYKNGGVTLFEEEKELIKGNIENVDLKLFKSAATIKITPYREAATNSASYIGVTIISDRGIGVQRSLAIYSGRTEGSKTTFNLPEMDDSIDSYIVKLAYNGNIAYYINDGIYGTAEGEARNLPLTTTELRIKLPDEDSIVSMADKITESVSNTSAPVATASKNDNKISATFNCKNDATMALFPKAYVGVYKDGALVEVVSQMYEIPAGANGNVNLDIMMDLKDGYEYKLFLWDSIGKRRPITDKTDVVVE